MILAKNDELLNNIIISRHIQLRVFGHSPAATAHGKLLDLVLVV